MRAFMVTAAATGLALGAAAFASPPTETSASTTAEDSATAPNVETPKDCSTLEGDAKTTCEAEVAAAAEAKTDEKPKEKGSKAKRSNTNRMERVFEDE